MIIENKMHKDTVKFEDIKVGDCFICPACKYPCIKIRDVPNEGNAVNLFNGEIWYFGVGEEVIGANAKVVIE